MRRIFILLVVLFTSITTFLLTNNQAFAKTSDDSATLMRLQTPTNREADGHVKILRAFLKKYNSPLVDYAPIFIQEADKNKLDWKLVASICGVESYFGTQIPYNSYNGWGFGVYGDHVLRFNSWDQGIATVSQSLRSDYINKNGATNVYEIGHMYAADPNWANKVSYFMGQLDNFESETQRTTLPISL